MVTKKKSPPELSRRIPVNADVRCMEVVGNDVWTGDRNGIVVIRKVRSGEVIDTLPPRGGANVWCIKLIKSQEGIGDGGEQVWTGLSNGGIVMFDALTRSQINHVCKHAGGIYQITENNGRAYSCSNDFEIHEWSVKSHQQTRRFNGHRGYVRCTLPLGPILLSGSDDSTIRLWDVTTGQTVHIIHHHHKGVHAMIKVGNHIWSCSGTDIIIWDLHTLSKVSELREHVATVLTLQRVGSRVYSGGADQEICAWDIHTHHLISKLTDHTGWVYTICNTAKVVRYYMWSTSINDSCIQVWSHDEYLPMNGFLKDAENKTNDMITTNPEAKLADYLQDACDGLKEKTQHLECDLDIERQKVVLLESELSQQTRAIDKQLGVHKVLSNVLTEVNHGYVPRLENSVREKDSELDRYVSILKDKNEDIAKLKAQLDSKNTRISELERKVSLISSEKDSVQETHNKHKEAHLKYIELDVDETLKASNSREEALRIQCESLRKQLVTALNSRQVHHHTENLEIEAKMALAAGVPRKGDYNNSNGWTDPSLKNYFHQKYYSSPRNPIRAARRSPSSSPRRGAPRTLTSPSRPMPPSGGSTNIRRHYR